MQNIIINIFSNLREICAFNKIYNNANTKQKQTKKDDQEDETLCMICLENSEHENIYKMRDIKYIIKTCKCNPHIHYSCITLWFDKNLKCPICSIYIKPYKYNLNTVILLFQMFLFKSSFSQFLNFLIASYFIITNINLIVNEVLFIKYYVETYYYTNEDYNYNNYYYYYEPYVEIENL